MLRSRAGSTAAFSAATAAVIVMAVTANGFPVTHVAANDGGVWLTNDSPGSGFRGTFGEFDTAASQLSYAFGAPGSSPQPSYDLDVLQQGTTVLAVDRGAGAIYPVDSQTGVPDTSTGVTYPVGSQVAMGGGVAAVLQPASGSAPAHLWAAGLGSGPEADVAGLNTAKQKPLLDVPGGDALAVDTSGDVYVASDTELVTLPALAGGFGPARAHPLGRSLGAEALTTVGTVPVVLDAPARTVLFPSTGRSVTMPAPADGSSTLVLQQSGPADAAVLVATDTSLIAVPLAPGAPTAVAHVPAGAPAAPVRLDGCAYGAWAGGQPQAAEVCGDGTRVVGPLPGAGGQPAQLTQPVFRVNHDHILLNDTATGAAWTFVGRSVQALTDQDWLNVLTGDSAAHTDQTGTSATGSDQQNRPKLDNPTLYARAGLASVLHVLDDDTDPGGSVLSIASVSPASGPGYTVQITPDTQALVLHLDPGASAPVTLTYTVVDGFGMTASGPVTVEPTTAENPPVAPAPPPVRPVVSGGTVHLQVLGGWRDPENDALSLADAAVTAGGGQVTWTSDGSLTFTAANVGSDTPTTITYHVTDGRSAPVAATIGLQVLGRGDTTAYPPTGVPDAVQVVVGQSARVTPLANDVFGADPNNPGASLALAGPVAGTTGLTVGTDTTDGTVEVTAARAGVFSLQYEASYGSAVSAPTQILVQAVQPAGTAQPPVTTPQSVLLHGQYPVTVDVLAGDYDPSGGVLTVVGASAPAGTEASVVAGSSLRIAATTADPPADQVVTYQVTNGTTSPVTGQVTVVWEPAMAPLPPVVPPLYVTVRAGDEIDVPVLATATDPDGEPVHLVTGGTPGAVSVAPATAGASYPGGLGSASLAAGDLRYAAPPGGTSSAPEQVTVSYVVASELGDQTTGVVQVTVLPDDPATATPPVPRQLQARVTAGGTVTIPVPTTGVAADGASATVVGIGSAPQLGQVVATTTDSITYQAFPFAPGTGAFAGGTDRFTYVLEGPEGLTGTGVVLVGVSPPAQAQPPVAVDHVVTAPPRTVVRVDLLSGAVVSPGDKVTVEPLSKTNSSVPDGATLDGHVLQVRAPSGAVPVSVAYGLTDGTAAPSVAHVLVRAESGYVEPPVAADYYPPAPGPSARTMTVDVLVHDSDPSGTPGDLRVVGSPVAGVRVQGGSLVIPVGPDPHAVPYEVRSRATGATAVGVVHVLGTDSGPRLTGAGVIHVPKDGSAHVDIGAYVTDPGHPVRLTTTTGVVASPAGGLSEQVDGNTSVTLTGLSGYQGPGALVVQVIDTAQLQASGARTAVLSIPVVVGNPTAVVRCPSTPVTVVEGGPTVDVPIAGVCQVWAPPGTDPSSVTFTASWAQAAPHVSLGWASGAGGQVLALTAGSGATGEATGTVTVGVAGGDAQSSSTLAVHVVAAPPPTASPVDPPPVETGHTAVIDMAQYVTSPLAQPQIDVVSVNQTSGPATPATASGSTVRISPQAGTHGTLTYTVAVSDQGPGRPDRVVDDTITLQVLDVPSVPTGLQGVPGDGQVALSWTASDANGAPVTHYVVSMGGATHDASGTAYTWTGLTNGQAYTFTVTAVNQVGPSAPSGPVTVTPRTVPDAPASVTATSLHAPDGTVDVSWSAANANGSPVTGYTVAVSPAAGGASTMQVGGTQTSITWSGLDDSVGPYTFTVIAHNAVGSSPASAPSNPAYAHGVPPAPTAPTATGQVSTDQTTTTVVVSFPAIANCNDAQPCASYVVTELQGGSPVATDTTTGPCASGGDLCATFGPITNDGSSYTYTLKAVNREGQTSPASGPSAPAVVAVGSPAAVNDLGATPGDGLINVAFSVPQPHGASITSVKYTASGAGSSLTGAWSSPGAPGQRATEVISGATNGVTYSITVVACNEANQCSAASNTATADPYGPPKAPTVTATGGDKAIDVTWSAGGDNGRPVAEYHICIDGTCTAEGANPGSTTASFACSTSHTVYGYVVDTVGQQSPSSATVDVKTNQCAPPGQPSVSAHASGNAITWSWSGGGGSGLPVAGYYLCVDSPSSCSNVGGSPGSRTDSFGCGQTHQAWAYVTDTAGQKSTEAGPAQATTATCPPTKTVTVSWGGKAPASDCGGDTSCTYLNISWSGFSAGSHTITPYFDGGYWGAPSQTRTGSSGTLFGAPAGYWAGYCRVSHAVTATVDGVGSNTINTESHGC